MKSSSMKDNEISSSKTKKDWKAPEIISLSFNKTATGGQPDTKEDSAYNPDSQ
jgi:hypothetical protein